MPGIYVANRAGPPGRAGLALPFTPTTGPVRFQANAQNYLDVPMYDSFSGMANTIPGGGIQTHLISQCAVFCAAEWTGAAWGRVYFAHVQGGDWSGLFAFGHTQRQQRSTQALHQYANAVNVQNCYSVLAVPGEFGFDGFADLPQQLGFPAAHLAVYISNTSGGMGFAVEFHTMGEFGELDQPVPAAGGYAPYGPRSPVGSFTNW